MLTLVLPADCSLRSVRPLYESMISAVRTQEEVAIDCSTLATIDLAGMQLLASAFRSFQAAGKLLSLRGPSDILDKALERAGISPALFGGIDPSNRA